MEKKYTIYDRDNLFIDVRNNETGKEFHVYTADYERESYSLEQWEKIEACRKFMVYFNRAKYETERYITQSSYILSGLYNYSEILENKEYKELSDYMESLYYPLRFYKQMEKDGYILFDKKGNRLSNDKVLKANKKSFEEMKEIFNQYQSKASKDIDTAVLAIPENIYQRLYIACYAIKHVWR